MRKTHVLINADDFGLTTGVNRGILDSHHHVHGWAPIQDVIVRLAEEYETTFRALPTLGAHRELWVTERFTDQFYGDGISRETLDVIQPGASIEVMVHPADMDYMLPSVTSYLDQRLVEKKLLKSYQRPDWWT
ncbi:ChbG/HpnK family deacetylase [Exiguobacterium alkaliphilum]|uniref:ChbG/HpnK family deacetylase n=1 Tax=Exiguobacterium alkaliphilum TaxID=1428684 RepID=UPI001BAB1660|nr:ChbG/HpnK family deacetylase [Exiguobacterium alkaliphilum]QUE87267.1 ChbG/HpnK family deacetylase [Exiguobacterium alkaliphilum]